MTIQQKQAYKDYIIDSIDSDAYDVTTNTPEEKMKFLIETFKNEAGWNIERVGQHKAFQEWIMGLPTVFNIEFENYKILKLAVRIGTLAENATEKEEDKILENYWGFITNLTFQLVNQYDLISVLDA